MQHCAYLLKQDGFFLPFLLAGLTGSYTHCVSMCGSFMACNSLCVTSCHKNFSRSLYRQASYHLGRLTTYSTLGFLAALLARQVTQWPFWPYLASAMLAVAAIIFIVSSLSSCGHRLVVPTDSRKMNYLSGLLLGFLPCGLIYAMLILAAATANPFKAMLGMALFVLGTIPAFLALGIGVEILNQKWKNIIRPIGRMMMAVNGLVLFASAIQFMR